MRLFVAIALPDRLRARLAALQHGLPRARWVAPENLHLTLRFIGEVEGLQIQDVDAVLTALKAPRFSLALAGLGIFGTPSQPRSLWAGVEPCEALNRLQAKVMRALDHTGLEPESWKFSPHVTLARFNAKPGERLPEFLANHASFSAPPFEVEDIVLYSSFLGRRQAIYRAEARYPLESSLVI